jgi:hypothetical protein
MFVRKLRCCSCGGDAGRWAQHVNRNAGEGWCLVCITRLRCAGAGPEEIKYLCGVEGVHWGMTFKVYERHYRITAAFRSQDAANCWMMEHPNEGPLAESEGMFLLADVNDKGQVTK